MPTEETFCQLISNLREASPQLMASETLNGAISFHEEPEWSLVSAAVHEGCDRSATASPELAMQCFASLNEPEPVHSSATRVPRLHLQYLGSTDC